MGKNRKLHLLAAALVLGAVLALASGCAEADAGRGTGTVRVAVSSGLDSKTIAPGGNIDVTHYVITLTNGDSGEVIRSDYMEKDDEFIARDVRVGHWSAKAEAFVENEDAEGGYAKMAEGVSGPVALYGGQNVVIPVVIESVLPLPSDTVSVELLMPFGLEREGDVFTWRYEVKGLYDRADVKIVSADAEHTVLHGGTSGPLLLMDGDEAPLVLDQGAYVITVTVSGNGITRTGTEVMRLIEGLDASGTIDLSATEPVVPDAMAIAVSDLTGALVGLSTADGGTFYPVTVTDGYGAFSVRIYRTDTAEPVGAIRWYVDGSAYGNVSFDEAEGAWDFSGLEKGKHVVTGVFEDPGLLMGGGGVTLTVLVSDPVEFQPVM